MDTGARCQTVRGRVRSAESPQVAGSTLPNGEPKKCGSPTERPGLCSWTWLSSGPDPVRADACRHGAGPIVLLQDGLPVLDLPDDLSKTGWVGVDAEWLGSG
jgi:hypothetical protein